MTERVRRHERIATGELPGTAFTIDSVIGDRSVEVFIPPRARANAAAPEECTLLVHFFGAAFVPRHAVSAAESPYVLAVVNLGGGSAAYERPFADSLAWPELLRRVRQAVSARTNDRIRIDRVAVSAFSAGYGGVRALLRNEGTASTIDAVLLLDGLHASYLPERTVLAEGGVIDTTQLLPFLRFAQRAVAGDARFVISHSEIFPGTFASTTETSDWLIGALGLSRAPVLSWGPVGMQQISEVKRGGFSVMGFAGNTGPDHIDHLHAMSGLLHHLAHSLPRTSP